MTTGDSLGERLRRLRRERGLTQADLAGDRLSESYVSLIESGRRNPTEEVLRYLADRLSCGLETILQGGRGPSVADAEMAIRRGEWETDSGLPGAALEHLHVGLRLAGQLGANSLVSRGRVALAKALEMSGQLTAAIEEWERLLGEAEYDPENGRRTAATVGLSRCLRELGELDRAISVAEELWRVMGPTSEAPQQCTPDVVVVGATLLGAYIEIGDRTRSRELSTALIALAESSEAPMATGAAYWNAAIAAQAEGRISEALYLAEKAQASMAQTDDVRNRARLQVALAGLHLRLDPPATEDALRLLRQAEPVLRQFGSKVDMSYYHTELARAYLRMNEYEQARGVAAAIVAEREGSNEGRLEVARSLMVLAAAESAMDHKIAARDAVVRAVSVLEAAGATRQAAAGWTELAELSVELGDSGRAIDAFRKANALLGGARTSARAAVAPADGGEESSAEAS